MPASAKNATCLGVPASHKSTPPPPDPDDLWQLARGYAICREAENYSPRTITAVVSAIKYLIKFLLGNGRPTTAASIGPNELRAFITHLKNRPAFADHPYARRQVRPLSDATINNYLRSLSAFWSWLETEDLIRENPFDRVKIPKAGHKVIVPFSDGDVSKLLAVIDTASPTGFRDRTMILVFLDCGLRLSELTGLKLEDVRLEENLLRVKGKGNKERMVPFGAVVKKHLWRYVSRHRHQSMSPGGNYLFLSEDGTRLSKGRIETMMRDYGRKAGLTGIRCSPHTLRHSAALAFLKNGGDAFSLQRLLGHTSLDVTRRYVLLADTDVSRAHRTASPVDNFKLSSVRPRRRPTKLDM